MRTLASVAVLLLVSAAAFAQAPKTCEQLSAEIAKKLQAKGVKSYSLETVPKDKAVDGKVVGTCERGTKKIVYRKLSPTPAKKS